MEAPDDSSKPIAAARAAPPNARTRLWASLVLLGSTGVLGIAIYLPPAEKGYGTHEKLGFQRCGMIIVSGLPCPSCGMTTAFSHTVRGQLISAFLAQPAGFALALACVATVFVSGRVVILGRWPRVNLLFLTPYRLFLGLLVLLLGGWGFKLFVGLLNGTFPAK